MILQKKTNETKILFLVSDTIVFMQLVLVFDGVCATLFLIFLIRDSIVLKQLVLVFDGVRATFFL